MKGKMGTSLFGMMGPVCVCARVLVCVTPDQAVCECEIVRVMG